MPPRRPSHRPSSQTKDVELKKLTYMFLSHYADHSTDCRELALMAIASYQKDIEQHNALVRGMALRVLCSIRVKEVVPIQLLSVKRLMRDMSPYVRKVCTLALTKIYTLDPSVKEDLIDILDSLLSDKAVSVLSSAIAAYNEICPERPDVLHRYYRKLCEALVDLDEWAQIIALNVLTRYARTQFTDPRRAVSSEEAAAKAAAKAAARSRPKKVRRKSGFYSDDESQTDDEPEPDAAAEEDDSSSMDADHALLVRACMPLLRSRNAGVVLAVAGVYHYLAPRTRTTADAVGRSLVRVLRGHRETQYIVLTTIVKLAGVYPEMFKPFLQDFFVAASEPASVKLMKVDVLASLATPACASAVLHEFTRYVRDRDKTFVCHSIRAISRIAASVPDTAGRVLRGLMGLVKTDNSNVVAESVVAIRQLLQQTGDSNESVVVELARMLPGIDDPTARSAIVWIVGEFQDKAGIAAMAPDTLRMLAKSFRKEHASVKCQALNLAVKLSLRNPDSRPIALLLQYVLELCKYDLDYDLRDRARQLRALLGADAGEEAAAASGGSTARATAVVLVDKPSPQLQRASTGAGSTDHQFGSLSFMVGHTATGYTPIPEWATVASAPDTRDPSKPRPVRRRAGARAAGGAAESGSESSGSESSGSESSASGSSSDDDGSSSEEEADGSGSESDGPAARRGTAVDGEGNESDSSDSD